MEKCPKPVRRLTRYGYCYYYKLRSVFKLIRDWWRYDTIRFRLGVDQSESELRAPFWKSNLAIATMETFQLLARNQVWFFMVLITRKIFEIKIFIFSILRWLKKWKKSDTTTGALQFVDGMTLFYCDANEDVMIPKDDFQKKSFHTRWNHWLFHFEIFISKVQRRYQID